MKLGIVGHGADKFTVETQAIARSHIRHAIQHYQANLVISGESPVGGIDIWAREEATKMGIPFQPYPAMVHQWDPPGQIGYKARNLQIAKHSDLVLCIVVKEYPISYQGMRFNYCYHCHGRIPDHIKSGGCWTAWRAAQQAWDII